MRQNDATSATDQRNKEKNAFGAVAYILQTATVFTEIAKWMGSK